MRAMPDLPHNARICNVAYAGDHKYFVMNALEPIRHTPAKTAPIYAHSGERLLSTIEPGDLGSRTGVLHPSNRQHGPSARSLLAHRAFELSRGSGIPVLKHLHNVLPHYVRRADGSRQLYLLVHGWSAGKFAVLKHEPDGEPSVPNGWSRTSEPLRPA